MAATAVLLGAGLNPETGTYVFQRYTAKQYGASPQNWGVAQDRRGVMYFANTDCLLEFDGNSWRKILLPNKSFVRSVSVDKQGTVYVGGVGEFGFLKADSTGTTHFVSLLGLVPQQDRAFADVWRILPTPQGVYFSTYSRLLRLNNDGTMKAWRPAKRFAKAFYTLNTLYVTMGGTGLMKMGSGDQLAPVPGGERFASEAVQAATVSSDSALMTTVSHLYRLSSTNVEAFPTGADSYFANNLAFAIQILPNGEIAVGTRKGGLVLLDPAGVVDRILSTANGLADDWVSEIHIDPQGGVWLPQNNGITRFNPALTVFGKGEKLDGDVQVMARQGGAFYAATSAGLFRLTAKQGVLPQFERVEGVNGSYAGVPRPYGSDLLIGTDQGVFVVSGKHATRIFESTRAVYDLTSSRRDPNAVYIARLGAVTVLQRHGPSWSKVAEFDAPAEEFRSVLEDADGRVWATTKGNVWRFDFRKQPVVSEQFGVSEGIPPGWVNVRRFGDHLVFATTKGLKHYDETSRSFIPDPALGTQFADGSRDVEDLFEDAAGNIWITGEGYHGMLLYSSSGYKWLPMALLQSGISEIYWMSIDPDGTVWATGADFVLHRWERALAGNPDNDFHVLMRRVQMTKSQKDWYGGAGAFAFSKLPWKENNLRFEFAAPFYEQPSALEYQVRLAGSDNGWTPWGHETQRDYTHLPEGSYTFRVRARTPHGSVAEDAFVEFGVLPPWYRTLWAYSTYMVFGGFGVWGIVRLRTGQLEADKHKLELIVEERTVEVRQQRDEIQVEQQKSQSLLLNILPTKVAEELKATGSVQPIGFDDVTVCFTDFVGFTVSSEKMAPRSLVDALNEYFTRFDEIISRYGLEKLKTIGDSYMFASGLPATRKSHAVDAVLAALEMVDTAL